MMYRETILSKMREKGDKPVFIKMRKHKNVRTKSLGLKLEIIWKMT